MENKRIIINLTVFLLIFAGCHPTSKQISKQANYYRKNYGTVATSKDTTILKDGINYIYHNGKLKQVGKMVGNYKTKYWYEFSDESKLLYVIKYSKLKTDTIKKPYSLINYSW